MSTEEEMWDALSPSQFKRDKETGKISPIEVGDLEHATAAAIQLINEAAADHKENEYEEILKRISIRRIAWIQVFRWFADDPNSTVDNMVHFFESAINPLDELEKKKLTESLTEDLETRPRLREIENIIIKHFNGEPASDWKALVGDWMALVQLSTKLQIDLNMAVHQHLEE